MPTARGAAAQILGLGIERLLYRARFLGVSNKTKTYKNGKAYIR